MMGEKFKSMSKVFKFHLQNPKKTRPPKFKTPPKKNPIFLNPPKNQNQPKRGGGGKREY